MIYDCAWPGCSRDDLEHDKSCCPFHFTRLPHDISLKLLFPEQVEREWVEIESEIQAWAVEIGLEPTCRKLLLALRENTEARIAYKGIIEIGGIANWIARAW